VLGAWVHVLTRLTRLKPEAPTQKTATMRKPRLARTESQKKRTAAKAAETRARNKAAKAQAGQPNEDARVDLPVPQIPQLGPESVPSGNVDNGSGTRIFPLYLVLFQTSLRNSNQS
jgi:hypothetical protein